MAISINNGYVANDWQPMAMIISTMANIIQWPASLLCEESQ